MDNTNKVLKKKKNKINEKTKKKRKLTKQQRIITSEFEEKYRYYIPNFTIYFN